MAQYKVPQDVEADDKLIGPFSFRQFVYLLIAGFLIALAVGLFRLFPLLAIIPIPFILFFLALALPLKKDQPMETYLAALISYYLKPHTRLWTPGQKESTILITAPKVVETVRTRDISGEEATHRLSFLADIVDTEGYAIKGAGNNSMREDLIAEANTATDMFDSYESKRLDEVIKQEQNVSQEKTQQKLQEEYEKAQQKIREEQEKAKQQEGREKLVEEMRETIKRNDRIDIGEATLKNQRGSIGEGEMETKKASMKPVNNSIMELANNPDFTVATIAKEANRIKGKEEGEVFISLH